MIQVKYFFQDIKRLVGKSPIRILQVVFSRIFWGLFNYRCERLLFSWFGAAYKFIRIPLSPIFFMLQAYSNVDIHYNADIKGGILIHHVSGGVVVSGCVIAGKKLTLTGGNIIGISKPCTKGDFVIGDNLYVGANATIIGPLKLGNNVTVGSMSCVTKSFNEDSILLIGIPAKIFVKNDKKSV